MEEKREISKIKIQDTVYDIKDEEVREALDILLGKKKNKSVESADKKQTNEDN